MIYSAETGNFVADFIGLLKHSDGEWYGKPFTLLDWQKSAVTEFYGTIKENGARQYQYLYLEIPKKNGKSELAAALGIYHTFADGEMRGEVYVCAADKSNASIIFNAALGMLKQSPFLMKRAKVKESIKEIHDTSTGTVMKVMSAEAYSKHGYKPSCVIFDELHAQPNRELWDIMTFGSGSARRQPVWIVLTTAGDDPDKNSIGWEIHEKARKIIEYRKGNHEGNYDNPVWLPFIYGFPDVEDITTVDIYDEKLWYECNPSLGHTIQIDTLRQEAIDARQSEATERLFRWLRLNQWISTKTVGWIPLTVYDNSEVAIEPSKLREALKGKRCYGGLDLSATTDLTAFVLLFPPQEEINTWIALFEAWIPSESMKEREKRDHVPYTEWKNKGYINVTEGDVIDYDMVEAAIRKAAVDYDLRTTGTDPWNSRNLTQRLMKDDFDVIEISQTMSGLSDSMKQMERLMRKKELLHEKNLCARWNFGNVRCAVDGNENIKPMKNKSTGRIDIAAAAINAVATAMLSEKPDINEIIMSDDWSM